MKRALKPASAGFTMIEVLIAMILLASVGAGLLLAFLNAGRIAQSSNKQNLYASHGDRKLKWLGNYNSAGRLAGGPLALGKHPAENVEGAVQSYEVKPVGNPKQETRGYRKVIVSVSDTGSPG